MGLAGKDFTDEVIGCAIEVHSHLGPGLLESAYEACLCKELAFHNVSFEKQAKLSVTYKDEMIDCGYRADVIVENVSIVEIKAVEKIMPIHEAQLLTYLKLSGLHVGLLLNFNVTRMKNGIKRLVL